MKGVIRFAVPWLIWLVGCTFMMYQFFLQISVSVMIPQLIAEFAIDSRGVGLLASSYFLFYIILQVPAGMLVDRFGARRVLAVGFLGCIGSCFILARAEQFWQAEVSRIFMGLTTSPAFAAVF